MTTFVTVGIEKIQSVLARSRHLWARRGASEELVLLTTLPDNADAMGIPRGELAVHKALDIQSKWSADSKVEIEEEALDIDGVVTFRSSSEDHAVEVGRHLARAIRGALPSTQVRISWVTIENGTYVDALKCGSPESEHQWESETYYPAPNEIPFVRTCDECGQGSAATYSENKDPEADLEKELRLCRDCYTRSNSYQNWAHDRRIHNVGGMQRNAYSTRFVAERWLLEEVNRTDNKNLTGVKKFENLAAMMAPDHEEDRSRTHTNNHTALFFADGNGLGALFSEAKRQAIANGSMDNYQKLSKSIKDATETALFEATKAIAYPDDNTLPAIPHIMGGDDLLVTLPADRAWKFIMKFFEIMEAQLKEFSQPDTTSPTVSAGVLFCKQAYPFGDQVEMAEKLLKKAKKSVSGNDWSIAWSDLTVDGPDGAHRPLTLLDLRQRTEALDYTRSSLPASAEAELLKALNHPDLAIAQQIIDHRVARIEGASEFLKAAGVEHAKIAAEDVDLINDITAMGRWWRR